MDYAAIKDVIVSIHALLAERDQRARADPGPPRGFNSRAPRGARRCRLQPATGRVCGFNSRAPRGARRYEHDNSLAIYGFNSRAPRGARHLCKPACLVSENVSIHALLAERDACRARGSRPCSRFNSRAPRGARRQLIEALRGGIEFQFTRSSRSATAPTRREHRHRRRFQFTRSSRSATYPRRRERGATFGFNSRAPRGARRASRRHIFAP